MKPFRMPPDQSKIGTAFALASLGVVFIGPAVALGCLLVDHPWAQEAIQQRLDAKRREMAR